jgi:hypothetical protein
MLQHWTSLNRLLKKTTRYKPEVYVLFSVISFSVPTQVLTLVDQTSVSPVIWSNLSNFLRRIGASMCTRDWLNPYDGGTSRK